MHAHQKLLLTSQEHFRFGYLKLNYRNKRCCHSIIVYFHVISDICSKITVDKSLIRKKPI